MILLVLTHLTDRLKKKTFTEIPKTPINPEDMSAYTEGHLSEVNRKRR